MSQSRSRHRRAGRAQQGSGGAARATGRGTHWHIVRYVDGDSGEPLYAVFRGGRRHAWGLRDRAAAERWLTRMNVPVQQTLELNDRVAS